MNTFSPRLVWLLLGSGLFFTLGCENRPDEPDSRNLRSERSQEESDAEAAGQTSSAQSALGTAPSTLNQTEQQKAQAAPTAPVVAVHPDDPLQGKFALSDALKGLPNAGKLIAQIKTSEGTLECELFEKKAPLTVANFVGLARGLRPFKDRGSWQTRPAYDGTVFHRIIKGFMIQGGDPTGTGMGVPGYEVPDEIWPGSKHDRRGQLCMANRGKNTNGQQFFVTDAAAPHLDGNYTIFGQCGPDATIEKLASVPTKGSRPLSPPKIESVQVLRK